MSDGTEKLILDSLRDVRTSVLDQSRDLSSVKTDVAQMRSDFAAHIAIETQVHDAMVERFERFERMESFHRPDAPSDGAAPIFAGWKRYLPLAVALAGLGFGIAIAIAWIMGIPIPTP